MLETNKTQTLHPPLCEKYFLGEKTKKIKKKINEKNKIEYNIGIVNLVAFVGISSMVRRAGPVLFAGARPSSPCVRMKPFSSRLSARGGGADSR